MMDLCVYGIQMREVKDTATWGQVCLSISMVVNYTMGFGIMKLTRYPQYYNKQSVQSQVVNPIRMLMGALYVIGVFMLSLIIYHIGKFFLLNILDHKMAAINSKVWVYMMVYCTTMDFFCIQPIFVFVSKYCMNEKTVSTYEKICYWRGFAKYDPAGQTTKV